IALPAPRHRRKWCAFHPNPTLPSDFQWLLSDHWVPSSADSSSESSWEGSSAVGTSRRGRSSGPSVCSAAGGNGAPDVRFASFLPRPVGAIVTSRCARAWTKVRSPPASRIAPDSVNRDRETPLRRPGALPGQPFSGSRAVAGSYERTRPDRDRDLHEARLMELLALRWQDLDEGEIRVRPAQLMEDGYFVTRFGGPAQLDILILRCAIGFAGSQGYFQ